MTIEKQRLQIEVEQLSEQVRDLEIQHREALRLIGDLGFRIPELTAKRDRLKGELERRFPECRPALPPLPSIEELIALGKKSAPGRDIGELQRMASHLHQSAKWGDGAGKNYLPEDDMPGMAGSDVRHVENSSYKIPAPEGR
jgi:hypothetical protein